MISGGFAGEGESSSARKAHLRSIRSAVIGEIQAVSKLPRLDTSITFSDSDLEGCQHPHDDPLVVRAIVANKTVHRVLVDNGSSADIIFASAFDKMGIGREKLEPVNTHLRGFSGEKVLPLGSIQLVLILGESPCQATTTARFLIVDNTVGHELLSFMDAFSGYNQISMDPDDQEKTSFVTAQGTYCYRVIPFRLKNAGATYQRLVNRMFQKQIGTTMKVYIDDMLVKSTTAKLHIAHLSEAFQILRNYNIKLNPAKCAFGVSADKFLGFIVNHRGIEANPDKIKAVLDMQSPSGIKEVQRLTGRITALSRFVSRASDKCQPFFQVLKKAFQWDAKCEEAFTTLKTYLSSPPILVSPIEGELLTLYLAVSDFSTSAVLVRDKERVQHPVYYCSRALRGAEDRYPRMENLILALVTAARKLRPYFQAHTIEVPTEYPMKQVLHKPETSGRLMKQAIELSEFDIRYRPKIAIKGQVLADFVMEFTSAETAKDAQTMTNFFAWKLFVDGASNAQGSGAGLILTSPEGIYIEYALRFGFRTSNNEAEYEVVIAGLNLVHSLEVNQLVYSDSQLVVRQIEDTYEAKSGRMILYL